ncbi:MAG: hypothetical protein QMD71_00160 [bacterium]|nr:hypothetical protein [bacterium]
MVEFKAYFTDTNSIRSAVLHRMFLKELGEKEKMCPYKKILYLLCKYRLERFFERFIERGREEKRQKESESSIDEMGS